MNNGASIYYEHAEEYWALVRESLQRIFQRDPDLADVLRRDIVNLSDEEQLFFYHASPFDIAAELAGIKAPTEQQLEEFRRLLERWP